MRRWLQACLETRAVVALLAFGLSAAATGALWLVPPGIVCYVLIVRANWRRSLRRRRPEPEWADLAPAYQGRARPLWQAQQNIERAAQALPAEFETTLSRWLAEIGELGEQALGILRRMQDVESYLQSVDVEDLEQERAAVQAQAGNTHDVLTRQHYARAAEAIEQQIGNYWKTQEERQRLDAQVHGIQWTLENVYAQLVRLQSVAREDEGERGRIDRLLEEVTLSVDTVTESLEGLESTHPPRP